MKKQITQSTFIVPKDACPEVFPTSITILFKKRDLKKGKRRIKEGAFTCLYYRLFLY